MEALLTQFLKHLTTTKGAASNTVAAYTNDLRQLVEFLRTQQVTEAPQATPEALAAYAQMLQQAPEHYAASTIARKMAACKSFFKFCREQGVMTTDPTERLSPPRVVKAVPQTLAPEEIQQLITAAGKAGTPKALRDQALLELLYATGMRVTEVVSVLVSDVNTETAELVCGEPGGPTRRLPLGAAAPLVAAYIEQGRPALAHPDSPDTLFLNHRGKRLTRQGVWLLLKEVAEAAGLAHAVTPHTLRHSFARHLVSQGEDLRRVQTLLGHANLSTTQVYRQLPVEGTPPTTA